jgi:peptide deformylase
VTNEAQLRQVSRETSIEECDQLKLWEMLKNSLKKTSNGVGLAAIQIGYPLRAALAYVKEEDELREIRLVNPVIVDSSGVGTVELNLRKSSPLCATGYGKMPVQETLKYVE